MIPLDPSDPQPGVYDGVPPEVYHGLPLISASGLGTLDGECPAQFRHDWDNPGDDPSTACDIGTACHFAYLEPRDFDRRVERVDVDGFQTKAARDARDAARSVGKTPLKARDYDTVVAMRESLFRQVGNLFVGGHAERTYIWKDPITGVLCKARVDYARAGLLIDFKTTGSANPRAFRSRVFDNSHHIQAWWYMHGHEVLTGERVQWRWVVQATKAPYLVTAHKPTASLVGYAEIQGRAALRMYAACLDAGSWPGYGDEVFNVELPTWAAYQLQERIDAGEFRADRKKPKARKALTAAQVDQSITAFAPLEGGVA